MLRYRDNPPRWDCYNDLYHCGSGHEAKKTPDFIQAFFASTQMS